MTAVAASRTTLHSRWLIPARLVWVAAAAASLGLFAAGVPGRFSQLAVIGQAYRPALLDLGLPLGFYGLYFTALDLLVVVAHFVTAGLIFWQRSDDWMALLVALTLVTGPLSFIRALGDFQAPARPLADLVSYAGLVSSLSLLYLFPDGRFVPPWTAALAPAWAALNLPAIFAPASPLSMAAWPVWGQALLLLGWSATGVYAQAVRYLRVSGAAQRRQTRWALLGLTAAAVGPIGFYLPFVTLPSLSQLNLPGLFYEMAGPAVFTLSLLARLAGVTAFTGILLLFPLSFAVAILRHRLWNIDLFVNRGLVYAALTGVVVGLYVIIVGAFGLLLRASGSLPLSILATGLIALLFQPLRVRLQRAVNRLMYGERDDPATVIALLGRRLQAALAPDAVAPTIVETVAQALRLPYAALLLKEGDGFRIAAEHGARPAGPSDGNHELPLVYQAEAVGRLLVAPRAPGDPLTPADLRLLEQIAGQAGAAVHAVRLTADLQRSRERLVAAREEERRRLRRDLHDELGPTLAGQALKLEAALDRLGGPLAGPTEPDLAEARVLLQEVRAQARATVSDIRRLVYDLRPPALDELGLAAALRNNALQHAGAAGGLVIRVEAPQQLPPLPAAVEAAAYRIAMEALTNVVRHAEARECAVRLRVTEAAVLEVEIADDGRGLPQPLQPGIGLRSMRERAAELGGALEIASAPAGGTRVRARLPLESGAAHDG